MGQVSSCGDIVNGFYSFLGFTRLTSKEIIQAAVARGVQEGAFGYFTGPVPTEPEGPFCFDAGRSGKAW